jgi:hypothetical protein
MSQQNRQQRCGFVILFFLINNRATSLSLGNPFFSRKRLLVKEQSLKFKNLITDRVRQKQTVNDGDNRKSLNTVTTRNLCLRDEDVRLEEIEEKFKFLLDEVIAASDSTEVPSILSTNIELVLQLSGQTGVDVIKSILQKAMRDDGEDVAEQLSVAIEVVLSFAEEFVRQTNEMENQNKNLLGEILRALSNKDITSSRREDVLDALFQDQREGFTPGFLRHIETQRTRIENAPTMSSESVRLSEMLSVIQTRVLEELVSNEEWGEVAQVLGQLVGYESSAERSAVLEAGLTVRGIEFADELVSLTNEALEGFQKMADRADPKLVAAVEDIKRRSIKYQQEQTQRLE